LGGPAGFAIEDATHEVYIADGSLNRRVVVYDLKTGGFKRGWGAYGIPLSAIDNSKLAAYDPSAPPAKQFRGMMSDVKVSNDGLVYVADRTANRIQVFTKSGNFLKEFFVSPGTLNRGTVMALAFSHDPEQKYLLVGDGGDCVVWILNRSDGSVAGRFGHRGYYAGQFYFIENMATDSAGNLYTGEVNRNYRVQKFSLEK
jgi:DNA-binding beta-propeller fold protein YncE